MDAYATNLAKKLKALLESTTTLQAYVLFKICGNCTGLLNIKKLFARMEPLSKYLMCTCYRWRKLWRKKKSQISYKDSEKIFYLSLWNQNLRLVCPAGIYLVKVNNRNTKVRNMFKVNNKDTRTTPGVVLVSLLLTLNIFCTLF